jgi:quinoprotein glucose dehydrogenase
LLFVPDGDQVNVRTPIGGGGKKFRVVDKENGEIVWETELGAGVTGAPMTYLHKGKQYIVVPIGGSDHAAEFVALTLP